VRDKNLDVGAGRRQQLRFPRHRRSVAGDDRASVVEIKEDWQPRDRLHARRARLPRIPLQLGSAHHQYTSC
jgi:hypothetical protein